MTLPRFRMPRPHGLLALACLCSLVSAPLWADRAASARPAGQAGTSFRAPTPGERTADARLDAVRHDPRSLRRFFERLPKGGDLHHHLAGAVATEYLIELAAGDGSCVETPAMTAVPPPCGPGTRPASDARRDRAFHDAIVRAWSMQDFPPGGNGHDHFFATFGKFQAVAERHRGKVLAHVADRAAAQNQFYLETMVTPAAEAADRVAAGIGPGSDPARLHDRLVSGGRLDRLVDRARKEADAAEREFRAAARCGTPAARPACGLAVRFISQVYRLGSPERVFTQMALGMRLAERDPRFVAVNLVQPEDARAATAGYRLHMRMLAHLRGVYPRARLTLHAGELWPGLVDPRDLTFHIGEAVGVARAERIGHGVSLLHEDDWRGTVRTMAAREVAVEVPFTSNAQILGVQGHDHPFDTYRRHGVPVVLATDDPGVSRIDISHEYQYAAETYGLSYRELKDLARASLEYAFLPGAGLWRGNPTRDGYRPAAPCSGTRLGTGTPAPACRALLRSSAKAAVQWRQEAAFHAFERIPVALRRP
ncbi:adenosine deaminase family protein [Streptomyces lavendofoliae]|uniref:adenosine deaminase n=1 Tax=Streptomyces lavendofoliae TaxID=67314 RepID=A0A918HWX0_9ACTN|nr:adenosine deaminase [Streptomyces lavendofoliae]GGU38258.1 adenosine deaminase [Streptomyces lavendofoliae]